MGRYTCLATFITSRIVARQVVDVVLVQLAQFFSDASNLLVHLGSDITDFVSEFVSDATNLASNSLNLASEFVADVGDFASNPLNLASEFLSDITNFFSNFGLDNINFRVYLVHTVLKPLGIDF